MISALSPAYKLRQEGNVLFEKQQYQKAIGKYTRIFAYTNCFTSNGNVLSERMEMYTQKKCDTIIVTKLLMSTFLNLCRCYSQLHDYRNVLKYTESRLKINPESVNALFWRAAAFCALKQFDKAQANLAKAVSLSPKSADGALNALLTSIFKTAEFEQAKKVQQVFASMLEMGNENENQNQFKTPHISQVFAPYYLLRWVDRNEPGKECTKQAENQNQNQNQTENENENEDSD